MGPGGGPSGGGLYAGLRPPGALLTYWLAGDDSPGGGDSVKGWEESLRVGERLRRLLLPAASVRCFL